jgi:small subunit ribosomal protein S12
MVTLNQLVKKSRKKRFRRRKTPALDKCPQKRGTCLSIFVKAPRKPNSANRRVVKLRLYNKKVIIAFIPGENFVNIQRYNDVLVRGGRVKDLPGIKYTLIRGKLDLHGLQLRRNGRSKYGAIDHKMRKRKAL